MARVLGTFYEFFAGAGMARAGLGDQWQCLFANDFDRKKAARIERQPLLRGAVQDHEVPAGVSEKIRIKHGCEDLGTGIFHLVQRGTPPQRNWTPAARTSFR